MIRLQATRVSPRPRMARVALAWALTVAVTGASAQTPPPPPQNPITTVVPASPPNAAAPTIASPDATTPGTAPTAPTDASLTLEPFRWLHGCWEGKVNLREFREEWLPLRSDVMVGVGQTVVQGKSQDFEYVRLESRPDGIFYVNVPSGKKETSFRFIGKTQDGASDIFTFENPGDEFPQRIIYRRGTEGWLYATVEGKLNGLPRSVIYPMRRVDCVSGEFIRK